MSRVIFKNFTIVREVMKNYLIRYFYLFIQGLICKVTDIYMEKLRIGHDLL